MATKVPIFAVRVQYATIAGARWFVLCAHGFLHQDAVHFSTFRRTAVHAATGIAAVVPLGTISRTGTSRRGWRDGARWFHRAILYLEASIRRSATDVASFANKLRRCANKHGHLQQTRRGRVFARGLTTLATFAVFFMGRQTASTWHVNSNPQYICGKVTRNTARLKKKILSNFLF